MVVTGSEIDAPKISKQQRIRIKFGTTRKDRNYYSNVKKFPQQCSKFTNKRK